MANVLHSSLTTTDLHEPKGVAAATSGQVYIANGAGSGAWTTPDPVVFPNKHIAGLTWSNAADASNDITVAAGTCRDSTNTEDMTLSASITKRIDASWAVGDNQGGFDTGSVSATGVYHIFLIKRTDTDVVDVIFTATIGGPTLPTNYTKSRRIGSIYRQSSVNVACTVTEIEGGGIEVLRTTPIESGSLGALATTGTTISLAQYPNNASGLEAIISWKATSAQDNKFLFTPTTVSANTAVQTATQFSSTDTDTTSTPAGFIPRIRTTSGQIKGYSSSGGGFANVTTFGWIDPRRS